MAKLFRKREKRVLLDIDTQFDMLPTLESQRQDILKKWRRIIAWARVYRVPVISTALSCREEDHIIEPQFCIEGTKGQQKVSYTNLPSSYKFYAEHRPDLASDIFDEYSQVIFERREFDPFLCERFERLVNNFDFEHYIIFGGGFEASIKYAGLGIRSRHKSVTLVSDAVASVYNAEFDYVLKKLEAKSVNLITTEQLTGSKNKKQQRKADTKITQQNGYIPSPVSGG